MIRNDFVSNSSSSSFMIVGICLDYDEALKLLKKCDPYFNRDRIEEESSVFEELDKYLDTPHEIIIQ